MNPIEYAHKNPIEPIKKRLERLVWGGHYEDVEHAMRTGLEAMARQYPLHGVNCDDIPNLSSERLIKLLSPYFPEKGSEMLRSVAREAVLLKESQLSKERTSKKSKPWYMINQEF